jgi:N6-L-threonylcarbamoyladenine synthase
LKTSVRYFLASEAGKRARREDVAASFQAAVVDVLLDRVARALDASAYRAIVLSGGVAANSALQAAFTALGAQRGIPAFVPERRFCTDNAAMIAAAAERRGDAASADPLTLIADPNLRFA